MGEGEERGAEGQMRTKKGTREDSLQEDIRRGTRDDDNNDKPRVKEKYNEPTWSAGDERVTNK